MNDLINTLSSAVHSVYINDASVKKKNKVDVGMDLLEKVEAVAQQLKDSPTTITSEDVESLRLCAEELESINPVISSIALPKLHKLISTAVQQETQSLHAQVDAPVFVETVTPTTAATISTGKAEEPATIATPPDRLYGFSVDEIREAIQQMPEFPKDASVNELSKAIAELAEQGDMQAALDGMIKNIGLTLADIPRKDLKTLITLAFATQLKILADHRSAIDIALTKTLTTLAIEKFKRQPGYEEQVTAIKKDFLTKLGVSSKPEDAVSEFASLKDLLFVQSALTKKHGWLANRIREQIDGIMTKRFDKLCKEIESGAGITETVKQLMGILRYLSADVAYNQDDIEKWQLITEKYNEVLKIKSESGALVNQMIENIFEKFSFLIEEGIVTYQYLAEKTSELSAEEYTKKAYGKTVEQVEAKKGENREQVVGLITNFADQIKSGAPLTIEMVQKLHRANNRGIVPQQASQMRKDGISDVYFFARKGVPSKDVEQAVTGLMDWINSQITKQRSRPLKGIWPIIVAKFHNDFLEMHPFVDRNGSTALLLTELLMAVGGNYKPAPKREKNYYKVLMKILWNPVAVAIVVYEQFRIRYVPGSYVLKEPGKDATRP